MARPSYQDKQAALRRALAAIEGGYYQPSQGFVDQADRGRRSPDPTAKKKNGGGGGWLETGPLGWALDVLDVPRAAVFSTAKELSDLTGGSMEGQSASLGDWWRQIVNDDERIYGTDVLYGNEDKGIKPAFGGALGDSSPEEEFAKHNKVGGAGRLAAGFAADILADPLTYLGGVGIVDDAIKGGKVLSNTEKAVQGAREAEKAVQLGRAFEDVARSGDPIADALRAANLTKTEEATRAVDLAGKAAAAERADLTRKALRYGHRGLSNAEIEAEYGIRAGRYARLPGTGRIGRTIQNVGRRAVGAEKITEPILFRYAPRSERLANAVGKIEAGLGDQLRSIKWVSDAFGGADRELKRAARGMETAAKIDPYDAALVLREKRLAKAASRFDTEQWLHKYEEATKGLDDADILPALRGDAEAAARLGDNLPKIRAVYDELLQAGQDAGANIRRIEDYAPNILTDAARKALLGTGEFKGATLDNVGKAFFEKARTLVPDANGNVTFLGKTWRFTTQADNVREADLAFKQFLAKNPDIAGDADILQMALFSENHREVFARYAAGMSHVANRNRMLERLAERGVGSSGVKVLDEAWLTPAESARLRTIQKEIAAAEKQLKQVGEDDPLHAVLTDRVAALEDEMVKLGADLAEVRATKKALKSAEAAARKIDKKVRSLNETATDIFMRAQYRSSRQAKDLTNELLRLQKAVREGRLTVDEAEQAFIQLREAAIVDRVAFVRASDPEGLLRATGIPEEDIPARLASMSEADWARIETLQREQQRMLELSDRSASRLERGDVRGGLTGQTRTLGSGRSQTGRASLDRKVIEGRLTPAEADQLRLEEFARIRSDAIDTEAKLIAAKAEVDDLAGRLASMTPHQFERVAKWAEKEISDQVSVMVRNGTLTPAQASELIFAHEQFAKQLPVIGRVKNWLAAWQVATPGFVNRNVIGGVWNNSFYGKAGVPAESYSEVMRLMTGEAEGVAPVWSRPLRGKFRKRPRLTPEDVRMRDNILRATGRGQVGSEFGQVENWIAGQTSVKNANKLLPTSKHVVPMAFRSLNEKAELLLRGSLAHAVLKDTGDIESATEWVYKLHFDYTDLSAAEQKLKTNLVPFYTWTRKNFPLQVEMLLTRPKNFNRYGVFQKEMEAAAGEQDMYVPGYYGREGFMPTPFRTDTGGQLFLAPDLPLRDINRTAELLTLGLSQGELDPMSSLSMVSPIFKGPIEYWAGKQAFKGLPLRGEEKPVALPKPIAGLVGPVFQRLGKGVYRDGKWYVSEKDYWALGQAFPPVAQVQRLWPSDKKRQEKVVSSWLSWFGFGTRTLTEDDSSAAQYFEEEKKAPDLNRSLDRAGL